MSYVISQDAYVDAKKIDKIAQSLKPIVVNMDALSPFLYDVVREEGAYGDLTDVHPSERSNVNILAAIVYGNNVDDKLKELLGDTYNLIASLAGLQSAVFFFIAPHSIVPTHVHDMERPVYDPTPHYNVFLGLSVPSTDSKLIGAKIDTEIYNNDDGQALVFDYQTPHSAWNNTDDWWLGIIFYINKEYFNEDSNS
jgi:hypothetical protein